MAFMHYADGMEAAEESRWFPAPVICLTRRLQWHECGYLDSVCEGSTCIIFTPSELFYDVDAF